MDPSNKENQTFELENLCVEEKLNSGNGMLYLCLIVVNLWEKRFKLHN